MYLNSETGFKKVEGKKKNNYVSPFPLGRSTSGRDSRWDVLPSAELL